MNNQNQMLHAIYLKILYSDLILKISVFGLGNEKDDEIGFFSSESMRIEYFCSHAKEATDISTANARSVAETAYQPELQSIHLSHEYGHFLSFKLGNHTEKYKNLLNIPTALWNTLNEHEINLIRNEEFAAWNHSKIILTELNFTNWGLFEATMEESLGAYESKFLNIK